MKEKNLKIFTKNIEEKAIKQIDKRVKKLEEE